MDTTAHTTTITVNLNQQSRDATIRKVQRLCDRAAKKGLSGGWTISNIETVEDTDHATGTTRYREILTLEGTPFAYNGWTFVAAVEWLEDKAFVSTLPGYDGADIDRDALVSGYCDHCQTTRRRNKVYIVESADGRIQVGSSCVKDYIGHDVAASFVTPESEGDEDDYMSGGLWKSETRTIDALAAAARIVRTKGYRAARNAEHGKPATTAIVSDYLYGRDDFARRLREEIGAVTDADLAEAQEIICWIADEFTGSGEYAQNLRVAASLEITTGKTLGTLVSAFAAKGYAEERKAEQAASTIINERYAADGEKVTVEADVTTVRYIDGMYGRFAFVTFTTDTHRLKWKATGRDIPEQGARVTLTGTVKGIDEWNGAVFTVVTRCKFQTV
jgi:hypothetical protein